MVGLEVAGIALLSQLNPRLEEVSSGKMTVEEETALIQQARDLVMTSNRDCVEVCTDGTCARIVQENKRVHPFYEHCNTTCGYRRCTGCRNSSTSPASRK